MLEGGEKNFNPHAGLCRLKHVMKDKIFFRDFISFLLLMWQAEIIFDLAS